uniref:Uncharacterized protein n=1 Tax=Opuntia streptacantha TaxID=393608 RepID=A0A7C9D8E2_OPUST
MIHHFGKMLDLFNTIIAKRLQGKRPSTSEQGNDVLDALLGLNQEKTEEIDPSKLPHLLLVLELLFSGSNSPRHFVERLMCTTPKSLTSRSCRTYSLLEQIQHQAP